LKIWHSLSSYLWGIGPKVWTSASSVGFAEGTLLSNALLCCWFWSCLHCTIKGSLAHEQAICALTLQ